jgi:hypothetical protein
MLDATTIQYTLAGVTDEGTMTVTMAANALTDTNGTPMVPFSGSYSLDISTVPLPTPTTAGQPLGSLVYQTGYNHPTFINPASDTDSFTLTVNAGEQLTALVHPGDPALRPTVQLFDSNNNPVTGLVTAPGPAQDAFLQLVAIATTGTYIVTVGGAAGTTGAYNVQVYLNAALEAEDHNGRRNDTRTTAQALSFLSLNGSPTRAAVLGTTDGTGSFVYTASAVTPTFEDISDTGHATLQGTDNSVIQLTPANLGGFTFSFYGKTFNTVYYNTNALINFTRIDSASFNTDLTTSPSEAAIAPLWTDYVAFNAASVVYWQVLGSGASQHLVIEWKNVQFSPGGGPFLTFEAILNSDGSIQFNYQDVNTGSRGTAGIKDAGTQGPNRLLLALNNGPNTFVGNNKSTLILPPPPPTPDFYSFTLAKNETATVALKGLAGGNFTLDLQDGAGNTLASGRPGATNLDEVINNFVAPANGTYYVRVVGATIPDGKKDYDLLVTHNADFLTEPNENYLASQAQYLVQNPSGNQTALGYLGGNDAQDVYEVSATGGQTLSIVTSTPFAGSGEYVNTLDPMINLYDPNGNLVASDDNSAPDGRNAQLAYEVPAGGDGLYFIQVQPSPLTANPTSGEYTVTVTGGETANAPFVAASTTIPDKAYLNANPTTLTVTFNHNILLSSLAASALVVDDMAATDLTVVNGSTVVFKLPTLLSQLTHTVSIADGAVQDVSGIGLTSYAGTFYVNTTPPNIIASSIQENDVVTVASGTAFSYTVQFSEPLNQTTLTNAVFSLTGRGSGKTYTPDSYVYVPDTSVLTLNYSGLTDDHYQLRIKGTVTDLFGLRLDGVPVWPIPPNHSGNGHPGSDFFVDFLLDVVGPVPLPTPLRPAQPLGSLIYQTGLNYSLIMSATDTDTFTLAVNSGQTITVLAHPVDSGFQPTFQLSNSGGVVGTATAPAAGKEALLQTIAAAAGDTYTITVGGAAGTSGAYTVQVFLNTALQSELHGGPTDDTRATAQDLEPSFIALPKGASRGAVLGTFKGDDDFYAFHLDGGQAVTLGTVLGSTGGTVTMQLQDAAGTVLATGTGGPTNLNLAISNFIAPATGTYYVRFSGSGGRRDYNLVITRGAAFDTEPNNTIAAAQDINGTAGALGYVASAGNNPGARVLYYVDFGFSYPFTTALANLGITATVATSYADFDSKLQAGGWDIVILLNQDLSDSSWITPLVNYVQAGGRAILTSWSQQQAAANAFGGSYTGNSNSSSITQTASSPIWAGISNPLTLHNPGWFTFSNGLAVTTGQSIGQFESGDSALIVGNDGRTILNGFQSDTPGDPAQRVQLAQNEILAELPALDDWYKVNAADGQTLFFNTSTPSDGPGAEFENTLAPHIELYDPSGTLVAAGTPLADGRNESITYTVPSGAAGIYRIRVVAENGTNGEYFLDPVETFAPTVGTAGNSTGAQGATGLIAAFRSLLADAEPQDGTQLLAGLLGSRWIDPGTGVVASAAPAVADTAGPSLRSENPLPGTLSALRWSNPAVAEEEAEVAAGPRSHRLIAKAFEESFGSPAYLDDGLADWLAGYLGEERLGQPGE